MHMVYYRKISFVRGGLLVGEILKKKREELGRDLREISDALKIKYSYLKAIEDGDRENLPAEVYVKGYLHEYAKILDLDPDSVLNTYNQEIIPQHNTLMKSAGPQAAEKKRFRIGYLLIPALCILAAIILASMQFPPAKKIPGTSVPSDSPVSPASTNPEAGIQKVIPQKEEPDEVQFPGHVLNISAIDTTWLEVMIDRDTPKEILLNPGDTVEWHAENSFSLKIGNAGGIRLVFDGKEITNLGEKGEVIRINLPATDT